MVRVLYSRASEAAGNQRIPPEEQARRIPSLTNPAKTNYICVGELYLGFAIWTPAV